jgi:uncharacterized protein
MSPRLILDTNIWVGAGFSSGSASAELVRALKDGRLTLVWDEPTRRETQHILRKIPPLRWSRFENLFEAENEFTGPTHPADFGIVRDPDDRKFAALAVASGAVLVTNDDDLLSVSASIPADIRRPTQALELLLI